MVDDKKIIMIHDDPNITLNEIFKNEKDNQFLRFKYSGEVDEIGLPHGKGRKEFIYNEKSYYDWEMLKWTPYRDTQKYFLNLGMRTLENCNYKNGKKHGKAVMHFRNYDSREEQNTLYCTFIDDRIEGYALCRGIFDDNFREHLVLQFNKGRIIHHFWNTDKSREKHLKKLKKNDDYIYSIIMDELDVFFTDESYLSPEDRSWTLKK